MLKQRVLTALWLLPLMLGMLFWANGAIWGLFCGVMTMLALWEYGRIVGFSPDVQRAYLLGNGFFLLMAWAANWQLPKFVWLLVLAFWLVVMPIWLRRKWQPKGTQAMLAGCVLMLPFWFGMMVLRPDGEAAGALLAVLVLVWIADSGAYFIGRKLGKRPLAPVISPKKSWEGAWGGWLIVLIYMCWAREWGWLGFEMNWFGTMLVSTILVAVSVGGDLLESWLKRAGGVKDSSQLLAGHGGVFDRIDSLIAVVAVYAAVMVLCA